MTAPTFDEFFQALNHFPPFPWQRRLAMSLADGASPDAIGVPTGLGKTSVLHAWMWALAVQASRPASDRTVPTRAVFVVDRRVIVDAAHEVASSAALQMESSNLDAIRWCADALRSTGHDLRRPLEVVRMRGGVTWSWRWLRQPDQPAVIVGTVDQFGSRLLFRGYGVGDRLRSIDAALLGNDAVAFLDEAHLSTALVHTVRTSQELEHRTRTHLGGRPLTVIPMTATPSGATLHAPNVLDLDDDDHDNAVVARRVSAVKLATLVDLPPSTPRKATDELAREMTDQALLLAAENSAIAVVVNTIDLARRVHTLLEKTGDVDAELAIGRCREIDRETSRRRWWARAATGRVRGSRSDDNDRPMVVVATQTIEVGADLDLDALVTEVAPVDSLIQRFGRVDRRGELGTTRSVIVRHPTRTKAENNPIYGAAADDTWHWLTSSGPIHEQVEIDFGVLATSARMSLLDPQDRAELVAQVPPTPELFDELLHLLSRTNPAPSPDLPVHTYLHGIRSEQATVNVVWRAGATSVEALEASIELAPLTTAEATEIPLAHVIGFLRDSAGSVTDLGDLDVVAAPPEVDEAEPRRPQAHTSVLAYVVATDGSVGALGSSGRPAAGATIVLDSTMGGHDRYGWTGKLGDAAVADVADLVRTSGTRLRLDPAVLRSLLGESPEVEATVATLLAHVAMVVSGNDDTEMGSLGDVTDAVLSAVRSAAVDRPLEFAICTLLDHFVDGAWHLAEGSSLTGNTVGSSPRKMVSYDVDDIDDDGATHVSGLRLVYLAGPLDIGEAADTELGSSTLGSAVPLRQHLGAVGDRAAAFASILGLDDVTAETLRLAGRAHDLGKAEIRFQTMLRGGDRLAALGYAGDIDASLAKSARRGGRPFGARLSAEHRWPAGMRHEAVSVALLRCIDLPDSFDADLVEHLVAAHHGWSRPLFPAVLDDHPTEVVAELNGAVVKARSDDVMVDWSQPTRFRRLCDRYGWWGLAHLEAILRLADIAVSEEGS